MKKDIRLTELTVTVTGFRKESGSKKIEIAVVVSFSVCSGSGCFFDAPNVIEKTVVNRN